MNDGRLELAEQLQVALDNMPRLCGEAKDNQFLISPRIYSKVEVQIEAEPVGELSLKGFNRVVFAHNVVGVRPARLTNRSGPIPAD